jgi:predicted TIM-barrel fold metal-dependent hydrolase
MTRTPSADVARIRAQLDHPVIDVDGHTVEVTPVLNDFVKEVGGASGLERFQRVFGAMYQRPDDGPGLWSGQARHWTMPATSLDRATAALPRLYYERMDEIGLDFSLVYPTLGIVFQSIHDDEVRLLACRAVNRYLAETHQGLGDRIRPVGVVPMHTPDEAIAELEYVVAELDTHAVMIPSFVKRPFGGDLAERGYRVDAFGVDSEHDYDPFWKRCVELEVVPAVHTPVHGMPLHESVTKFVYTHVGQFASGAEVFCRSTFIGGVYHRFPTLRVAALEGGMGWAAALYAGLLGHWEKRNGTAIDQYNPAHLDHDELRSYIDKFGDDRSRAASDAVFQSLVGVLAGGVPPQLDDFVACPLGSPEDLRDMFTSHIYVGCEADDPMNALAFDAVKNPLGARFRPILGSDIGHWDVTDVGDVLREAYELVDDGLMTERDFEEFVFTNPARLYAGSHPEFFAGTKVEGEVADLLAAEER